MNFKTTIVLLILLIAVGVYFGVEHFTAAPPAPAVAAAPGKIVPLKDDDIVQVSITPADGKPIDLQKTGSAWRLTAPINAPADTFAVEDLLRQLTGLQSRGKLSPDRTVSVGLDHPKFVVEITARDQKKTRLRISAENKIGDSLYVLVDDQDAPQIVATAIYDQLNKQPQDYRSKKLIDLTSDATEKVHQLSITQDGKTISLEKTGESWEITEPRKMPADASAVSSLLSSLADLNASDFVESPEPLASYGLAKPDLEISYSDAAPATAPATQPAGHHIAFGRFVTLSQKQVYASADGGPLATVDASSQDAFKKTALDLRDKKIVDIDPKAVASFTLAIDHAATTQPTTKPAEQSQITIARRKESSTLGPVAPATHPATTQPTSLSSTQPTTRPSVASTKPAAHPAVAAKKHESKWMDESDEDADANDANVEALLTALHPLNATKFIEKSPATQPAASYTLTIHEGPADGKGPQDITLHLTSPGATGDVIGTYGNLTFDLDRSILDKLDAKLK